MLRLGRVPNKVFAEPCVTKHRVLPSDSDWYQHHMTNSRFAAFADLGRLTWLAQTGVFKTMRKQNIMPIVSTAQSQFFGLIRWGKPFEVVTRPCYWEDNYLFLEHRFIAKDKLCAIIISRLVLHNGKASIPVEQVWQDAGQVIDALDCPEYINDLKQALKHRF